MIANCGEATYIELDIKEYRIAALCRLNFKKWKTKSDGLYYNNRGYVVNLSKEEIIELLTSIVRVTSIKKYMDVPGYVKERTRQINNAAAFAEVYSEQVMMQR